jgi:hypothetical protein
MTNTIQYHWQGGRLISSDGRSLSISEAYSLIPFSKRVRDACKERLRDYRWKYDGIGQVSRMRKELAL